MTKNKNKLKVWNETAINKLVEYYFCICKNDEEIIALVLYRELLSLSKETKDEEIKQIMQNYRNWLN